MDTKQHFSLWYFFGVALALLLIQTFLSGPHQQLLAYSDFQALLQAGKVKEVGIADDQLSGIADLTGFKDLVTSPFGQAPSPAELKAHDFVVARVPDANLVAELQAAKVKFAGRIENRWLATLLSWVAPAVVFVVLWNLVVRFAHGRRSDGRHDGRRQEQGEGLRAEDLDVTFADVEGIDEAKEELMEVVDFLKNPERYRRLGGQIPKGILIIGAPGTGKSICRQSRRRKSPFFLFPQRLRIRGNVRRRGGSGTRLCFAQAEKLAPCIVSDELRCSLASGVNGLAGNDEREQTLNQLLANGWIRYPQRHSDHGRHQTGRKSSIRHSCVQGRFDRHVAIDRPDIKGRNLRLHAKRLTLGADVDLAGIAAERPRALRVRLLANIVDGAGGAALRARINSPWR